MSPAMQISLVEYKIYITVTKKEVIVIIVEISSGD